MRDLEYLEEKCGIHFHHLFHFVQGVLIEVDGRKDWLRYMDIRRHYYPEEGEYESYDGT